MKTRKLALAAVSLALIPSSAWSMVIAKVNGQAVSDQDVHAALSGLNVGQQREVLSDMNSKRQVVNQIIDQKLLDQEAHKERLDQDAQYKAALANFKKQYMANRVLQKNLAAKLTEAAAKRYYNANKERYSTEEVHAEHILVSSEEEALQILKMAKKPGADFEALAARYSKDPSAKNNRGDIGFFTRAQMVPAFTNAAFAAKPGQIVGPVHTQYGYHIIKVLAHKPGKILEFDDVEARVKRDLQAEVMKTYLERLRKSSRISINDNALRKL